MKKFKGTIIITDPCYIFPRGASHKVKVSTFMSDETMSKRLTEFTEEEHTKYNLYKAAVEKAKSEYPDYWSNGSVDIFSGEGMKNFGFTQFIWEDTLYGDWSCTTFELEHTFTDLESVKTKEKPLGRFCADAGLVAVFLLDEVLKWNPEFDYHTERPHTTTCIKDFDGTIEYKIINGDAYIVGTGSTNFITSQTGL
jgi:hypothetical protein